MSKICTYHRNGMKCTCGCVDPVVRLECVECGAEPLCCDCMIRDKDVYYRIIRLSDGSVINDL